MSLMRFEKRKEEEEEEEEGKKRNLLEIRFELCYKGLR